MVTRSRAWRGAASHSAIHGEWHIAHGTSAGWPFPNADSRFFLLPDFSPSSLPIPIVAMKEYAQYLPSHSLMSPNTDGFMRRFTEPRFGLLNISWRGSWKSLIGSRYTSFPQHEAISLDLAICSRYAPYRRTTGSHGMPSYRDRVRSDEGLRWFYFEHCMMQLVTSAA